MTKRTTNILIIIILSVILWGVRRGNIWYDSLTSNHRGLTIAHVYDVSKVKGHSYYHYIYKVNGINYTTSTSGRNVDNLDQVPIQCFLLAFDKKMPTTHIVIWSRKYKDIIPLNTIMSNLNVADREIKRFTLGMEGLSPTADINDLNEIKKYERKIRN